MKSTKYILSTLAAGALALLAGCDVNDPIYNTAHPNLGKLSLTTTWDNTNLSGPPTAGYTVVVGDYSGIVTTNPAVVDNLFAPGSYTGYVYTAADKITVGGTGANTVATVAAATAPAGATGTFVARDPAFLYTGRQAVTIAKDAGQAITVQMVQQVRELTLVIRPDGDAAGMITGITAALGGAAGAWNLDSNAPSGDAVSVAPGFTRQGNGDWTATVRLLGITGTSQVLEGGITFSGGPGDIPFSASLHDIPAFAAFNTAKKSPMALEAHVVKVHDRLTLGDFAPISGWTTGNEEDIHAD